MLEIEDLSVCYNENEIFSHLNLKARPGQLVVVTGLSGCGKSSLLKVINGVIPEACQAEVSGSVRYREHDLLKEDMTQKSHFLSTVFQNPKTQFYCINSTDELAFGLENRAVKREQILKTIDEYTTLLQTKDLLDKDIFSLSGGEKQLLAITAVACLDNDIYLFDEPSASLDRNAIHRFMKVIEILKSAGKIVIIAEHRLYYLKDLLDQVLVIDGKRGYNYSNSEFIEQFDNLSEKHHLRDIHELSKQDLPGIQKIRLLDDSVIQNESDSSHSLLCSHFKVSYDCPILNFSAGFMPGVYFIIGENGVGKSTVANLLTRFWDVRKGSITIGGVDIKDVPLSDLMDQVSVVFQRVYLFKDTIYNNISMSRKDASREEVIEAAKLARCYDFIMDLPDGFDTVIGEGGASLSGGEMQRLSIARCILKDAPIIILDEATASVDADNELYIQQAINELCKGKTLLVIAHRLNTIRHADNIIVIRDGQIEEQGCHDELMNHDGLYSQFVRVRNSQASWNV